MQTAKNALCTHVPKSRLQNRHKFSSCRNMQQNQQGLSSKLHGVVGVQEATERAGPSLHGHGTRGMSQVVTAFGKNILTLKLHLAQAAQCRQSALGNAANTIVMHFQSSFWAVCSLLEPT